MSETPRTDAHNWNEGHYDDPLHSLSDFAKQLERELNAANAIIRQQQLLDEENLSLRQRIRQLEEAGDGMVRWIEDYGCKHEFYPAISIWTAAKEAKP